LDYRAEAIRLGPPPTPILDLHSHINGAGACRIYDEARRLYGVTTTYSMSRLEEADAVRAALGDSIQFISMPDFMHKDRAHAHGPGYIDAITAWHRLGARIVKFWVAPRGLELGRDAGDPLILTLRNPWRRAQMDHAASLGMMFMVHVADPDTWFATRYSDASFYGTKRSHYEPLEALIEAYRSVPWILAHMGGWPEDLEFLDGLLTRHCNANLDTSATKWIVREVSKHPSTRVHEFLARWRGRIFFGSDIVTTDRHLTTDKSGGPAPMGDLASSPEEAFELYCSRYWALRTMWETTYDGESPIADPDLMMVDPQRHDAMSAPRLRGHALPREMLIDLYRGSAERLLATR
jgi:hypothetical protein